MQSTSVSELPKARFAPCGHAPRTCVSVLQSTSASELPEARHAQREHPPRSVAGLANSRGVRFQRPGSYQDVASLAREGPFAAKKKLEKAQLN